MPKIKNDYPKRLRTIRRYVDGFMPSDGYDLRRPLTPSQKRRITITYEKLRSLTARPVKIFRPRRTDTLKAAQREAHGVKIKGLRVAFIPVANPKAPAKIRVLKSGRVKVTQSGVNTVRINIDPLELARDPIAAVNKAIKSSPAKQFGIQAGNEYRVESKGAERVGILAVSPRNLIASQVAKLISQYGADKFDTEDSNSHYYGNWLFGVIGYEYEKLADYRAYNAAFNRQREAIKRSSIGKRFAALSSAKKKRKSRR